MQGEEGRHLQLGQAYYNSVCSQSNPSYLVHAVSHSAYLPLPLLQVGTGEKRKVMGVLDIYGFEILEVREYQTTLSVLHPR